MWREMNPKQQSMGIILRHIQSVQEQMIRSCLIRTDQGSMTQKQDQ